MTLVILFAAWFILVFFSVRLFVLDFQHSDGTIGADTWAISLIMSLFAAPMAFVVGLGVSGAKRKAFFLPPKRDKKSKEYRERYPYVRAALGKIFVIKEN